MTYIFCYDDHRSFTDEVKKRFSDSERYVVESYHNPDDFLENIKKERDGRSCRVAIIGVPDSFEQYDTIAQMTLEIKKADRSTGIILLVHQDKLHELKKAVVFNIEDYIPRNSNAVLRIHNNVKRLISEKNISIFRKRRNMSLYVLLGFAILIAILLLVARIKLPHYF
ncbi:MAG: hypothetical protein JXR66_03330 [Bacteroidales bacterium]|nr:hypothetical protein [Bacteroidales bacterium]